MLPAEPYTAGKEAGLANHAWQTGKQIVDGAVQSEPFSPTCGSKALR